VFTGIVEETGTVREFRALYEGATITVAAQSVTSGLKIGDSISVNGVCLTTIHTGLSVFTCNLSAETVRLTSFKHARQGMTVNLELPLAVGGRLGGHFVQGHVDGIGRLIAMEPRGEGVEVSFAFPKELDRYLVYKGSIAVDGISLTISSLQRGKFSVAVIPHTLRTTNLKHLNIGDPVNLEIDILGKYFERFFQLGLIDGKSADSRLTPEYLKDQGF